MEVTASEISAGGSDLRCRSIPIVRCVVGCQRRTEQVDNNNSNDNNASGDLFNELVRALNVNQLLSNQNRTR